MPDFLRSARAKLDRANEHLDAITAELFAHGDSQPYRFIHKCNPDFTEHTLCFKISGSSPFLRWSMMIGDCLQCLRACLDHALYGLAYSRSFPKLPRGGDRFDFPICKDPNGFPEAFGKIFPLRNDIAVRTGIEGLQPYHRGKAGWIPPLIVLKELNRIDKHRDLLITYARAANMRCTLKGIPDGITWIAEDRLDVPLEDGTEVWKIILSSPVPDVEMYAGGAFFPAIRYRVEIGLTGTDGDAIGIDFLLEYVRDEVAYCLDAMASLL